MWFIFCIFCVVRVKETEAQALSGRMGNPLYCGDGFTCGIDLTALFDVYRILFLFLERTGLCGH
jgi:hypothetical protein